MDIAVFSTRPWDRRFLDVHNTGHTLRYLEARLDETTVAAAAGAEAVCAFVNDRLDVGVLEALHRQGVRLVVLRSAGFNHVDLVAAARLGLAVYEEEADLFFRDLSDEVLHDDVFARLLTFPNVLVTGHQAFFTVEALTAIAQTTIDNVDAFVATGQARHPVSVEKIAG